MKYFVIIFLFSPFLVCLSQSNGELRKNDFGISFGVNYISSASIQLNPYSSDIVERNTIEDLKGGYSYGFNLKKKIFFDNFYISLSTEYISMKDETNYETLSVDTNFVNFGVREELKVIPVEAAIIYRLPEFFKNFNVYIGGGAGIYFGDRIRTLYRIKSTTLEKDINLNLNIFMGTEYYLSDNISAYFEMKFREGRYEVKSKYPVSFIVLDGIQYVFNQNFHSRIYIDGIRLSGGINYYFR